MVTADRSFHGAGYLCRSGAFAAISQISLQTNKNRGEGAAPTSNTLQRYPIAKIFGLLIEPPGLYRYNHES